MTTDSSQRSGMAAAFLAGLVVVALVVAGITLLSRHTKSAKPVANAQAHLPFGPEEQQAATHIHFQQIQLSEATNLLNQRFTYVTGIVSNDGTRTVDDVEVTIEFRDILNQVALRDTRRLFGPDGVQPLGNGQNHDFQITFESFPSEWNHQLPSIRVVGVALH